jgi:hypothetical protein
MTFLRIRPNSIQWPYTVSQFRIDEPRLSISDNPHNDELASYRQMDPPILIYSPEPTAQPEYNSSLQQIIEVQPINVDGTWRQQWQIVDLPTPPPSPDFEQFRTAIRSENGFQAAWEAVLNLNPMLATAMTTYLETFRKFDEWQPYLESLTIAIQLLPTESERVYIANEFLQLARRCHLNPSFIAAFEAIISTETGQGS